MRIHLKINTSNTTIPFDHQPMLVGTIHKWLGRNEEHGSLSLYSFSRLDGGKAVKDGLVFEKEASFFFSAHHEDLLKRMIKGIQSDPSMFYGLSVSEITIEQEPDFLNRELFLAGSPIFIKRRVEEKIDHILYDDDRASACLKETLLSKMALAGIADDTLEIAFDRGFAKAKTQKINYKGVDNRASWCPVIIKASPQTKAFAWNVGLGNSTGIGFGAIK